MWTTAYLKAIMEVYGKTLTGLGPKDTLVAMRNTVSITVVHKENTTVHHRQITDSIIYGFSNPYMIRLKSLHRQNMHVMQYEAKPAYSCPHLEYKY